jgi:hypothetical protein
MLSRLSRLTPLTGVVFAVLALAGMASAQVPPGVTASGGKVLAFAVKHAASQRRADLLLIAGFSFFVFFAGSLRAHLRRSADAEAASAVALAGAAIMASGAAIYFGFDYALASAPGTLAPAAAQALNVLALQLVFPLAVGGFVFGMASGVAILRGRQLPAWLGWAAVVIGLLAPVWIIQVLLLYVWTLTVSVLLWRRSSGEQEGARLDSA